MTGASISCVNSDGTVTSIYCSCDGYLSGAGKILSKYYNTYERVKKLMELGDLEGIGKYLNKEEQPEEDRIAEESYKFTLEQAACDPAGPGHEALIFSDLEHFDNWVEGFNYMFMNGGWHIGDDMGWSRISVD